MGLSIEQRKAQARELCVREYGIDPETLRKDSERYRWLREHSTEYSLTQKDGYGGRELIGWNELDAAIDAAMAAAPAVGAA